MQIISWVSQMILEQSTSPIPQPLQIISVQILFTAINMVEKAPIVKEYKRAGTFLGARGTRVLRLVTTFLTLGILVYS